MPDAVVLQDVCWLLRVVERAVGNGGGSAHELVGGAVDGCGASLLFVIPSASAGAGTAGIPTAGGHAVNELALCGGGL